MKRPSSSGSFNGTEGEDDGLIPISSSVDEESKNEFLPLDGTGEVECWEEEEELGGNGLGEKKRRLSMEQVKALEKTFEVDNKLDPERKLRLAQDLGLQPRQVAVWFQNRRARSKTKELERDYGALKARHDALKLDCDAIRRDNEALLAKIRELQAKLEESENKAVLEEERPPLLYNGASDNDSSAVFNDETSPYAGAVLQQHSFVGFKTHCPSLSTENKAQDDEKEDYLDEEFLGGDEEFCSSLFSEQQAPSLSWYCSDEWD